MQSGKSIEEKSGFSRSGIVLKSMLRLGKSPKNRSDKTYFLGGQYDGWLCIETLYLRPILIGSAAWLCSKFVHVQLTVTICRLISLLFSTYRNKFDTKMKQNYMPIMIMNVPGKLCQLIHYFPGKQGLSINLTWSALKSKQRMFVLPPYANQWCGFSSYWYFNLGL